jgi:hypothetical protein
MQSTGVTLRECGLFTPLVFALTLFQPVCDVSAKDESDIYRMRLT